MLCLVLLALVSTALSASIQLDEQYPAFRRWALQHGKTYTLSETELRFNNFKRSVEIINANNEIVRQTGEGATFGLNKFSDLSAEEFAQLYLTVPFEPTPEHLRVYAPAPRVRAPPQTWDWRDQGRVTAVKDQGQCGSCWAFSATESIESVWMIAKGITNATMPPLSPQQIVDCDGEDGGCNGGDTTTAFNYVISAGGLESNAAYPYAAEDESCSFDASNIVAKISAYKYLTQQDDEATLISNTYSVSPPSICVDAHMWQYYQSGIMSANQCQYQSLDHCVQIVGYDLTAPSYWLVRNSWNTDWGENGFIRLAYGQNTCGVTNEATTAVV